ncbi:hypothetical protein C0J52_02254 [Blattella germanica]|nr:hypothetical protein C0J52_02254 [Blattella germanica]
MELWKTFIMNTETGKVLPPHPRASANPLSILTFSWTHDLFRKGYRKELEVDDLYGVLDEDQSGDIANRLQSELNQELKKTNGKRKKYNLIKVIIKCFGPKAALLGLVLGIVEVAFRLTQPLFLGGLIRYFSPESDVDRNTAFLYAACIVICSTANIVTKQAYMLAMFHNGMKLRALKLSQSALRETTIGQAVNLISNDVNRFDMCLLFIVYVWIGPLHCIIIGYILWREIGISAIVIKMYAWEKPFAHLVSICRRFEIKAIRATAYARGFLLSFDKFSTRIAVFITVLVYVITAYFGTLKMVMADFFPRAIQVLSECYVSVKRIQNFLLFDEVPLVPISKNEEPKIALDGKDEIVQNGSINVEKNSIRNTIKMCNVSAKWSDDVPDNTLTNINLEVLPGQLVAVIGPVGAGKTSLMHAILKELPISSGSILVGGTISYASQEAWLFTGSVRQNILFEQPLNKERYRKVVRVCALERDFELFPHGDKTIVGERGVTLSGGQKARVNLARAIYKEADVYLLDDPLSAVDTHVGRHLFEDCICDFLHNKTRLLITHQVQYLQKADNIIILDNGLIEATGTFSQLQESGVDFAKQLGLETDTEENLNRKLNKSTSRDMNRQDSHTSQSDKWTLKSMNHTSKQGDTGPLALLCLQSVLTNVEEIRQASSIIDGNMTANNTDSTLLTTMDALDFNLTFKDNEETVNNTAAIDLWNNATDFKEFGWIPSTETCIYIYIGLMILLVIFSVSSACSIFILCMRASMKLHDAMFGRVIRATMQFFHKYPSGQILNRFSKDMGSIDESLPYTMFDCIQIGLSVVGVVLLVSIVNLWLLIPTVFMFIMFYLIRQFYLTTARSLKRLESIARSPAFTHLSASIQGLTTIRAFGAQALLEKEFDNFQDQHSSIWYLYIASNRAFGLWLDSVCLVFITLVTFSFLLIGGEQYGSDVGLAITQAIGLTGMLQWGIRQSAELENLMTSVERVLEYTELEKESSEENILAYSKTDPAVLKNVSFVIKPGEKVGIVGRTGAGKSSLITALFQLVKISNGSIRIDGVDTSLIGLYDLRSKISIIPQEPALFSGPLRENLDPFNNYSDAVLWSALDEVEMKHVAEELPAGLTHKVSEGGSNFSVGQRQLLCLARAIIRNNKILVLDEATANEFDHPYILLQNKNGILYQMAQQTGHAMAESLHRAAETSYEKVKKWLFDILKQGYKKDLEIEHLYDVLPDQRSEFLGDKLERLWSQEIQRAKERDKAPSLFRPLVKCFGLRALFIGLSMAFSEFIFQIAQPIFLGGMIRFFTSGSHMTRDTAYLYAGGVIVCSFFSVVVKNMTWLEGFVTGMKMRVAVCSVIYRKTLIIIYLMWNEIGLSAFLGIVMVILIIPVQAGCGKMISILRLRTALRTDERIRLMNEIVVGIQAIKMYAWEKPFAHFVSLTRRKEIQAIRATCFLRGLLLSFGRFGTKVAVFVSIVSFVLFGEDLTAEKMFVVAAYFNIMKQAMTEFFPLGITELAETIVSVKRVQTFLMKEEITTAITHDKINKRTLPVLTKSEIYRPIPNSEISRSVPIASQNGGHSLISMTEKGIKLSSATAKWTEDLPVNTLSAVDFEVKQGQLLAIIGPVGSGKSSLLHAILKELQLSSGSILMNGSISYSSQEPWLFTGTVRQNILFGQPMNRERYRRVVRVCALDQDFGLLPHGDKTIVGERGVTLSGGQRARITLARAVYKDADLYLLDDPLSAVDTHVGRHLFEDCICDFLKDKTRILVTHQLQYLQMAENIIILNNGAVEASGTFTELQNSGLDFAKQLGLEPKEDIENKSAATHHGTRQRNISVSSQVSSMDGEEPEVTSEMRTHGRVDGSVYRSYFSAGGSCFVIMLIFVLNTVDTNTTDLTTQWDWLLSTNTCIYIYSGLIGAVVVLSIGSTLSFFAICMRASIKLHNTMFESQILNRFSRDMGTVDEILPATKIDCIQIGISLLGSITIVAIVNPWLLIPSAIMLMIFYILRVYFVPTSRMRSPVFSHLNASLQGLTTIRALGAEMLLKKEFDNHQDLHTSAQYMFITVTRAFALSLDTTCLMYIALVTFSFLVLGEPTYGGDVGLAIYQAIGLTGLIQWGIRQTAELENQMTSVERVLEYTTIKQEPPLETSKDKKPTDGWPLHGVVTFDHIYLSYSKDGPLVLRNVNFSLKPTEKVGIVGRTGAGKSSLITALFRLMDLSSGSIRIDDVDISLLGLHDLRSKISIIPQEPVLFSGTLRDNLDPFSQYSDAVLWSAIEEVELKQAVDELPAGLNHKVSEGGSNFSVGQRQLLCLARAIIRNNKILVLDEATANVDPQTDELIQATIRRKFTECTILTVAHRLHTVMDSDRIIVMDAGSVVYGSTNWNIDGRITFKYSTSVTFLRKWVLDIFKKGYKKDLELDDLLWAEELKRANARGEDGSLLRVLIKCFGRHALFLGLVMTFQDLCLLMVQPIFLGGLIRHFSPNTTSPVTRDMAFVYAGAIIVCETVSVLINHLYCLSVFHTGMKMRVGLCSLIYRKIEIAVIPGMAVIVFVIPIQAFIGKLMSNLRMKTAKRTDRRIMFMNEIIVGMQVIKMYAWEKPFAHLVSLARKHEIKVVRVASYLRGFLFIFGRLLARKVAIYLSVVSYVLIFDRISPEKMFVVVAYFNILTEAVTDFLPLAITHFAEAYVSVKRIRTFLLHEEVSNVAPWKTKGKHETACNGDTHKDAVNSTKTAVKSAYDHAESKSSNNATTMTGDHADDGDIQLTNVTAKWSPDLSENTLTGVNLIVKRESLVAIIGPVGSGKTSLLHTILKELPLNSGSISTRGTISYASQEPWLFTGSVRQNILFGQPFKKDRYKEVVKVCALERDFQAVYKEADVYLLDDPLSAVDTHVGRHLFEDCICDFLQDKTRLLVTHQVQYLQTADNIVILSNVRTRGKVSSQVYRAYCAAGGNCCITVIVFSVCLLAQVAISSGDYWMSEVEEKRATLNATSVQNYERNESIALQNDTINVNVVSWLPDTDTCIYVYTGLIVATVVFVLASVVCFFTMCMRASVRLHDAMFASITRATMWFFNNNPSGQILNRFSKDMGNIDEFLPQTMIDYSIGASWSGVCCCNSELLVANSNSSDVRTLLCAQARSPVFSHLSATLQGMTTIRAFGAEGMLEMEFDGHQDLHSSAWFTFVSSTRAFALWLDSTCVAYLAVVTLSFLFVVQGEFGGGVGLAITQSIGLLGMLQWGMRQSAELENHMTSVERILEYTRVESEPPLESEPGSTWPAKGEITFDKAMLAYSKDDPPVLKGITFTIRPCEKVGIVGRTGAGKSSLITALFRLVDLSDGSIKIDEIDTGTIGLHDLRSKISIIPQEPALFSGPLRDNLDPFSQYSDAVLWSALDEVELKQSVEELPAGLSHRVSEGGSNFSVGQRQLLCLARAIVRNNKILVLDEATANVDPQTDELIQATIRRKFADCTVLTIAHRLHTVMDSDRIIVMDAGKEFDHPHMLLRNENGILYQMVEQTGHAMAESLFKIAKNNSALLEDKKELKLFNGSNAFLSNFFLNIVQNGL